MKKLNRLVLGTTILITLTACGAKQESKKTIESTKAKATVNIVLKEDHKEFNTKNITVKKADVLYDILKENYDIEDTKGFITSINGHKQNEKENKYWLYTINGKQAEKGVQETQVSDGDDIVFDLSKLD
ncbi:DUF4430 domain-containing protein [Vagococcus sp. JNUCC 83]